MHKMQYNFYKIQRETSEILFLFCSVFHSIVLLDQQFLMMLRMDVDGPLTHPSMRFSLSVAEMSIGAHVLVCPCQHEPCYCCEAPPALLPLRQTYPWFTQIVSVVQF